MSQCPFCLPVLTVGQRNFLGSLKQRRDLEASFFLSEQVSYGVCVLLTLDQSRSSSSYAVERSDSVILFDVNFPYGYGCLLEKQLNSCYHRYSC
jgi:hypothetical protein